MSQTTCPECGHQLQGNESSCPNCGHPILSQIQASSPSMKILDEGDNNAEEILKKVVNALKWLIIIFTIGGSITFFIMGIVLLFQGYGESILFGIVCIVGSVINLLLGLWFAKLIWALGMIFINISNNVRAIKKIIQYK